MKGALDLMEMVFHLIFLILMLSETLMMTKL